LGQDKTVKKNILLQDIYYDSTSLYYELCCIYHKERSGSQWDGKKIPATSLAFFQSSYGSDFSFKY